MTRSKYARRKITFSNEVCWRKQRQQRLNYWDIWNPYDPNLFPRGGGIYPQQPVLYSPQLQTLITTLGLNQAQIDWLNQQPDDKIVNEIYNFLQKNYSELTVTDKATLAITHLDHLMNDPEYVEMVNGYSEAMISLHPWMLELFKELGTEIGIKVIKKYLPGYGDWQSIKDAIENAGHGDWLGVLGEVLNIVKKKVPVVAAVDAVIDAFTFGTLANKAWKVFDKIKVLPTNAFNGIIKTLKDKTGGILDKIHIDPSSTQGFANIKYDPADAANFFDDLAKNISGSLPNTFTSSNGGVGKYFSIGGFTINFYSISTSTSEPTIEIKSTTSNWSYKMRFSL